jgi:D-tyrosyl-tRNA(Tyr) deacylase
MQKRERYFYSDLFLFLSNGNPMKILIQRVSSAQVEVDNQVVGAIGQGALVFLGITHSDTVLEANWLANKLINLRMFQDSQEKMNLSLLDIKGEVLIVSQFTLYGDCTEGRRPAFIRAAPPEMAEHLYLHFIEQINKSNLLIQKGVFGALMKISLVNDGPVTFMIER